MLQRLAHFFTGHIFKLVSSAYCPGDGFHRLSYMEMDLERASGFTQFVYICDCGKVRKFRAAGKHEVPPVDSEVAALRKMAEL